MACAHGQPHPSNQADKGTLVFQPQTIVAGGAQDRELAQLNADELFAKGKAAFAAQDYGLAARCFTRGADVFPDSPLQPALAYNAGLALMQQHEWALALERFKPLAQPATGTGDALDAAFQEATCAYFLDDYPEAAALLAVLAARKDIPETQRLAALVDLGVCQVEQNLYSEAEHSLREALRNYQKAEADERMPEDVAAKGEFFLGEIYRIYFQAVKIDPTTRSVDELGKDLEQKAEELLSAQGHYLRAIRIGSPRWATGAGFRIGSLYEDLYSAMVDAPLPKDLDEDQAALYREELKRRIRVLVTKAINIYDQTLAAANRIGEENPFVAQTHQSLEHMKSILLAEKPEPPSAEAPAAAPTSTARAHRKIR